MYFGFHSYSLQRVQTPLLFLRRSDPRPGEGRRSDRVLYAEAGADVATGAGSSSGSSSGSYRSS
jgi:hypothetical protein